jgi:hypothetical protein
MKSKLSPALKKEEIVSLRKKGVHFTLHLVDLRMIQP